MSRLFAALCWLPLVAGAAPPGDFVLEAGQSNPNVASWGERCGPRPGRTKGKKGGRYTLTADGLLPGTGGATPLFATGVCGLATGIPKLHERRAGNVITCASTPGSGRQVEGRIERVDADLNTLRVNQRFSYRWTLDDTECAMTVRGSYRLRRETPIEPPPPEPTAACATPGPLARVRGTRAGASVEAGQSIRLRLRGEDAAGCPVPVPDVTWTASAGRVRDGDFQAADVPPGTTVQVRATAGRHEVRFAVEVVEPVDLTPALPAAEEIAPAPISSAAKEGVRARNEMHAPPRPAGSQLLVGLFVGLGLAILGIGMWISWRTVQLRRSDVLRQALADEEEEPTDEAHLDTAPFPISPSRAPDKQCPTCERVFDAVNHFCPHDGTPLEGYRPVPGKREAPAPARVCPTCEAQLPANATFCPHDGSRLGAAPEPTPIKALICPECGAHYPDGTVYCGVDGARLVLIN